MDGIGLGPILFLPKTADGSDTVFVLLEIARCPFFLIVMECCKCSGIFFVPRCIGHFLSGAEYIFF